MPELIRQEQDEVRQKSTEQMEDEHFVRARQEMVKRQLAARDIDNQRVLEVMGKVPRQLFVPAAKQKIAYQDSPLQSATNKRFRNRTSWP